MFLPYIAAAIAIALGVSAIRYHSESDKTMSYYLNPTKLVDYSKDFKYEVTNISTGEEVINSFDTNINTRR